MISRFDRLFRRKSWTKKQFKTRQSSHPRWQLSLLEPRQMLAGDAGTEIGLAIDLRGETGRERVEVWAGDYQLGTQFLSTEWQRFDFDVDSSNYQIEEIQVRFVNDLYRPENGFDRNVYVGTLYLNGDELDPNSEDTFSTGTWRAEDGVVAGTGRGSVLNANGYLQFAGQPLGSRITVYARGDEGSETFILRAGEADFAPVAVSTQLQGYEFYLNETVSSDAVRIEYFSDRYLPSFGIDTNLTVDRIELDGVNFETESPDVFLSGSYFDGARQEGFLQTETLYTNGFIQYGATTLDGPRYAQSSSVSGGDGRIEFEDGSFVTAASLSDGGFVGASQDFFSFELQSVEIEVFDSAGNADAGFNDGNGLDLLPVIAQVVPDGAELASYRLNDLLVDSEDRIIAGVSASVTDASGQSQPLNLAVRVMRSGDLDSSFGDAGIAVIPGLSAFGIPGYSIDALDRLIAVDRSILVRFDSVGQLDQGFGDGGVAAYQSVTENQGVEGITTREDRSIVLLTSEPRRIGPTGVDGVSYVYQFNENGTTGTWFGDSGAVAIPQQRQNRDAPFREFYTGIALDSSERIVLTGNRTVIRLTSNGQFDSSFGDHGVASLPNTVVSDGQYFRFGIASGPTIDSEDRVILAAEAGFIRLDVLGQLDTSFSQDGYGGVPKADGLLTFDVSDLQMDSLGRLFSPIRSINTPSIAVWELV